MNPVFNMFLVLIMKCMVKTPIGTGRGTVPWEWTRLDHEHVCKLLSLHERVNHFIEDAWGLKTNQGKRQDSHDSVPSIGTLTGDFFFIFIFCIKRTTGSQDSV